MKYKEYMKVSWAGILSAAIISSVYSYLSNVESITVMTTNAYSWRHMYDGIVCYVGSGDDNSDYCDTIAFLMANAINGSMYNINENDTIESGHYTDYSLGEFAPNAAWKCASYTDFSSKTLYNTFESFRNYIIVLLAFTIIYATFAIIHDFTLIYHKQNLQNVSFHPVDTSDFYLTTQTVAFRNTVKEWKDSIVSNGSCLTVFCCGKVLYGIFIFFLVCLLFITFFLDGSFMLCIYPFLYSIGFCKTNPKRHYVNVISYVSASWVGISRWWLAITTIGILYWCRDGFSMPIHSLDPGQCHCECNYVLNEFDFYKLFFTTLIFIGLNIKFLWSWVDATSYQQHSLYLITYRLPIKYAHAINSNDCTGSMMQVKINTEDGKAKHSAVVLSDLSDMSKGRELVKDMYSLLKDKDANDVKVDDKTVIKYVEPDHIMAFAWRSFFLLLVTQWYIIYGAQILFKVVILNYYHYPEEIRIIGFVVAITASIGACIGQQMLFKYLKKSHDQKST